MLTIDGVTVRLGGRAILERASATVPVGARVGLRISPSGWNPRLRVGGKDTIKIWQKGGG